jgi:hypothetical protein
VDNGPNRLSRACLKQEYPDRYAGFRVQPLLRAMTTRQTLAQQRSVLPDILYYNVVLSRDLGPMSGTWPPERVSAGMTVAKPSSWAPTFSKP